MKPPSMSVATAWPVFATVTIAPLANASVRVNVQIVCVGKPLTWVAFSSPAETRTKRIRGTITPGATLPGSRNVRMIERRGEEPELPPERRARVHPGGAGQHA